MYRLVKNSPRYWDFIRKLRSDPRVQDGFIEYAQITEEEQRQYMSEYGQHYYVCLYEGVPSGFVGVIDGDIRVCAHPDFQKQGIGTFMINEITKVYPRASAKIKVGNRASVKLFEGCGFEKKYFVLEKSDE